VTLVFALLVVLHDGVINVPPASWFALPVSVPADNTALQYVFEVKNGTPQVQTILLPRAQMGRFERGRSVRPTLIIDWREAVNFRHRVKERGEYVLVIDNRIEPAKTAVVDLKVVLNARPDAPITELPESRRRAVVALSVLFFGAVVAFTSWRFLRHASF
jgi:hypothetical protein